MKIKKNTLISYLFGLSFILFSVNMSAIEGVEIKLDENKPVVKMEINIPSTNEIEFYLYNANERIIFRESAELFETFESQFDFSEYRNGTYTLVSEVGNMRYNKVLEVNDSRVELIDSYYSFTPVFQQEGDLLTMYFINNQEGDIDVSIDDISNTYYDTYYVGEDRIVQKVYSLENLRRGEYTFRVKANGEIFNHVFEVE